MKILQESWEDFQKRNLTTYYETVLIDRAIPDVRDGLKPIGRKLIWVMHKEKFGSSGKFIKCARVTGLTTLYSPHGTASSYDALCKMLIEFNNNQPLVKGHGGFENIHGDPNSAERYSESKLQKFTEEVMLKNLNEYVVDFVPNFDRSTIEPSVLPSKLPYILINGSFGIAAGGFSSSLPPHSIKSSIDITIDSIKNPEKSMKDLIEDNKFYPEFPHGGIVDISNLAGLYSGTHSGSIQIKSRIQKVTDVPYKGKKYDALIVTEIPYMQRMNNIISSIKEKKDSIDGLKNLRDDTNGDNLKYYLLFERGTNLDVAESQVLKYTKLQDTFNINFNLINNGKLVQYDSIKEIISDWIDFRRSTVKRIKMSIIRDLEKRIHILDALITILDKKNIDNVIKIFKEGESRANIREVLISKYGLDDIQANHIIELKLYQISKMEIDNFIKEKVSKEEDIKKELVYLRDQQELDNLIISELEEIKNSRYCKVPTHSCDHVYNLGSVINDEMLIQDEEFMLISTKGNFIKKIEVDGKTQGRLGKGNSIGKLKDGDIPLDVIQANSKDNILLVTDKGNIFRYKCYDIPTSKSITTLGTNINSLINNEKLVSILSVGDDKLNDKNYGFMVATKMNMIKIVSLEEFVRFGKSGIMLTKLRDDDSVIACEIVNMADEDLRVIAVNNRGFGINLALSDVPSLKRPSYGSSLFKPFKDSEDGLGLTVVGVKIVSDAENQGILIINKFGLGKRIKVSNIPQGSRYNKGVIVTRLKDDDEVAYLDLYDDADLESSNLMVISSKKTITITLESVNEALRPAYGVNLQRLDEDDFIVSASIIE